MQWLLIHSLITSILAILLALVFYSIASKNDTLRYARHLYYAYLLASVTFATLAVRSSQFDINAVLLTAVLCVSAMFAFVMLYLGIQQWQRIPNNEESSVKLAIAAAGAIAVLLHLPDAFAALGLYLTKAVVFALSCQVIYTMLFRASDKHYGHYFACLFMVMVPISIVMSIYYAWRAPDEALSLAFVGSGEYGASTLAVMTYAVFPVVISGTGIFFLMTMMMETVNEAKLLAIKDPLTGLYNRRGFEEMAGKVFQQASRYRKPACLIMCDIDNFKQINDRFGHDTGDAALKFMAQILESNTRRSDILCRYGGEEFVALLTHSSLELAQTTAERIRERVEHSLFSDRKQSLRFTASFGVVEVDRDDGDLERAITQVDSAMYEAKNSGKNRVCVYTPRPADNNVTSISAS